MPAAPEENHDRDLALAFDGQAARFEKAPVQTDPQALGRLVEFAELKPGATVLDAGCGPGLVSLALLQAEARVVGVDLSDEMIERARVRCQEYEGRSRFFRQSLFEPVEGSPFDAAISRFVLHHVTDPRAFIVRQVELLQPGGVLILCDHSTDPEPGLAENHNAIERARDRTHTCNLTSGEVIDLFASAGLGEIRSKEEAFTLDFDEWFDRGTPALPKLEVHRMMVEGPPIRGFRVQNEANGSTTMHCWRMIVRGVKPQT